MAEEDAGDRARIHHHTIASDGEMAGSDLLELVAEIEGCDVDDLPPLWTRIDDVVENVFSDPPAPEAQIRLQFTYAGYRIDLDQGGHVELMPVADGDPTER